MNRSAALLAILTALGALGLFVSSGSEVPTAEGKALKKIRRSCQSTYRIQIDKKLVHLRASLYPKNREEGARWFHTTAFVPAIPDFVTPLRFKGSARCGQLVPNRCRARASSAAFACMEALRFQAFQSQRWSGEALDSMQNPNGSGPPPEPDPLDLKKCPRPGQGSTYVDGALDFQGKTIAGYFKRYVCAAVNGWLDDNDAGKTIDTHVHYVVYGRTAGDKGCGAIPDGRVTERKIGDFGAICKRERNAASDIVHPNKRIRARGYRQIRLATGSNSTRCRRACMRDPRCLSWDVDRSSRDPVTCELYDRYHPLASGQGTAGMK